MAAFQVGSTCYPSGMAAAYAAASSQTGQVVPLGSSLYVVDVQAASDMSITYRLEALDTTASIVKTVPYNPIPCGLLDTADGLLLGGAVAVVWIATAAVNILRRGVHE
jgi:hypothetical protein